MEDKHIMFGGKREHPRRFEKTSNLFDFKLNLSLKSHGIIAFAMFVSVK